MICVDARKDEKLERAKRLLVMSHDAITATPEFEQEALGVLLARDGADMNHDEQTTVLRDIRTLEAALVVKLVRYEAAEKIRMSV
jgi:hypothetical protein